MKQTNTESGVQAPAFVKEVADAARGYYARGNDFEVLRGILVDLAYTWDVELLDASDMADLTRAVFDAKDKHPKAVDALTKVFELNGAIRRRLPAMEMLQVLA